VAPGSTVLGRFSRENSMRSATPPFQGGHRAVSAELGLRDEIDVYIASGALVSAPLPAPLLKSDAFIRRAEGQQPRSFWIPVICAAAILMIGIGRSPHIPLA
jgi:hypothetical protein